MFHHCGYIAGDGGYSLGVSMGLHSELCFSEQRAVVQSNQLHPHHNIPLGYGGHDPPAITAQGHPEIQSGRILRESCSTSTLFPT